MPTTFTQTDIDEAGVAFQRTFRVPIGSLVAAEPGNTTVLNEPDFVSDSAENPPSQQSVRLWATGRETALLASDYATPGVGGSTAAINAAMAANPGIPMYFGPGDWIVDDDTPILPPAGTVLLLAKTARIVAAEQTDGGYQVVYLNNPNVGIIGGEVVGDRNIHTGTALENGHCIAVGHNATDWIISDVVVRDAWGDGIYLGSVNNNGACQRGRVINVTAYDCRRNNFSIVWAQSVLLVNCTSFDAGSGVDGTLPQCGFDFEPNATGEVTEVTAVNCAAYRSVQDGFKIQEPFSVASGSTGGPCEVVLNNCVAEDNTVSGFDIREGGQAVLNACTARGNGDNGYVVYNAFGGRTGVANGIFTGCQAIGNVSNGFNLWTDLNRMHGCDAVGNLYNYHFEGGDGNILSGGTSLPDDVTTPAVTNRNILVRVGALNTIIANHISPYNGTSTNYTDQSDAGTPTVVSGNVGF